jgi:hypothetical protein
MKFTISKIYPLKIDMTNAIKHAIWFVDKNKSLLVGLYVNLRKLW